jgi:circadian clock protein KaiB
MPKKCLLKLYVSGSSPASQLALRNLREIISRESNAIIQLKVIDVRKHPQLAEKDKILAVPTLIKELPPPIRKIVGDLSEEEKVLLGLDIIRLAK